MLLDHSIILNQLLFKLKIMKFYASIFFTFFILVASTAQDLGYTIVASRTASLSQKEIVEARSMMDIKEGFPLSWIKEILHTSIESKQTQLASNGDKEFFSTQQKIMLENIKIGDELLFKIKYVPNRKGESELSKMIEFAIKVAPEKHATCLQAEAELDAFMEEEILTRINKDIAAMSARFVIDNTGKLVEPIIEESSGNIAADAALINALIKMKNWKPAQNSKGENVAQEFQILIGNQVGC